MNKTLTATALVAALMTLAPMASAAPGDVLFTTSGGFLVGEPVGYLFADACSVAEFEGTNSNCFAVPAGLDGKLYGLDVTADIDPDAVGVCFYGADGGFLDCDSAAVPAGTASVSVSAFGGLNVEWTFTVYE